MKLRNRIVPVVVAGIIGMSAVAATAPGAHAAATCTDPGPATNFKNADGSINVTSYLAAVAAFNTCVQGTGASTTATPAAARRLALTGSDSGRLAVLGVALAGVGAGAVGLSRRRHRADATTGSDLNS